MNRDCRAGKETEIDWAELEELEKLQEEIRDEAKKKPVRHGWTREDFTEYRRTMCRIAQQKRRKSAKKRGLCSICAANTTRPGMKTCGKCGDRYAEYAKKRRTKEKE